MKEKNGIKNVSRAENKKMFKLILVSPFCLLNGVKFFCSLYCLRLEPFKTPNLCLFCEVWRSQCCNACCVYAENCCLETKRRRLMNLISSAFCCLQNWAAGFTKKKPKLFINVGVDRKIMEAVRAGEIRRVFRSKCEIQVSYFGKVKRSLIAGFDRAYWPEVSQRNWCTVTLSFYICFILHLFLTSAQNASKSSDS